MKKSRGFTLIELMIVVAIIALLAMIALPSYDQYVRKTRRTQAKTDMLEISQMLEREFTLNRSYAGFPVASHNVSPKTGTVYYNISYTPSPLTAAAYTITATPTGAQTGDKCGNLTLSSLGVKTASGTLGVADCW